MKKLLSLTLMVSLLAFNSFMLLEGAMANAATTSSIIYNTATGTPPWPTTSVQFDINQEVNAQLSLLCLYDSATMTEAIDGLTGGSSATTTECLVKTNNFAGYDLYLSASDTPALEHNSSSSISFGDDQASVQAWNCATGDSEFGFEVTGTDKDSAWNAGGYRGFTGSTLIPVAARSIATDAAGVTTTFNFKAEVGATKGQASGYYTAHITATAVAK